MDSPFSTQLAKLLAKVQPTAFERLEELDQFSEPISERILGILLEVACQSQHIGNIQAGRDAMARVPREWLREVLPRLIDKSLNLKDEWEYRRLLELLKEVAPEMVPPWIDHGLASLDTEIHEAAEEFATITAGRQP